MTPDESRASTIPAPPPAFKVCGCTASYTVEEWSRLEVVADNFDLVGDGVEYLSLRNCSKCHSTIAVVEEPALGVAS